MQLPSDFIIHTKSLLKDDWDRFVAALDSDAPTSIRLNKVKCGEGQLQQISKVEWCEAGYYLESRPQFTFDPLFHAGVYYVQEASSMFIAQAIKQYVEGDVRFLDLCAAPGGKSTLINDLLTSDSLLVSNEVIRSRSHILSENIAKWGNPNVVVTNNDAFDIGKLTNYFDAILVDAPCSGEGMFRKDERAITEWSLDNVKLCKERQQRILADVWSALKPGGLLLYSTCTYNIEENDENVIWVQNNLGAEVLPIEIKEEWGISPSYIEGLPAYHFFPHKTKGEGFFFALLRKNNDGDYLTITAKKKKSKEAKNKVDLPSNYKDYLKGSDRFSFYEQNNNWFAVPSQFMEDIYLLESHLNVISKGICLGEYKGRDFIPAHSLAVSSNLNRQAFELYDVDWKTAITYLRKETLVLPPDVPKGYVLLTYRDVPIGFVKNIGNRANNLYPQEWRIRSSHIPRQIVNIMLDI